MLVKKFRSKILNISVLVSIIILFIGLGFLVSYIFLIKLTPSFDDENFNYIKSLSPYDIKPGDEIQLELSYQNTGFREVKDVYIEFKIPSNTKLKSSVWSGKYFEKNGKVILEGGSLKRGEGAKVHLFLIVDKPLDNDTEIKVEDVELQYKIKDENFTKKLESQVVFKIVSSPIFYLSPVELKDVDGGDLRMGDEIDVSFLTTNTGDMNGRNVIISAKIPPKTEVISDFIYPQNFEIEDDAIIWNFATYEINKETNFKFRLKVLNGFQDNETINQKINLVSEDGKNISMEASIVVKLFPDLGESIVKLEDKDDEYTWPGDIISASIIIKNTGDIEAKNVKLICNIPANTILVKNSARCENASIDNSPEKVTFLIDKIDVNEEKKVSIEFQISPKMTNGGAIKTDFYLEANRVSFNIKNADIKVKPNFKVTIACMGDSLIALSNWPQILGNMLESTYPRADYNVIASGIQGETASRGFQRFDSSIAKYKPQIVIIGYGTNDTGGGTDKFRYYLSGIVGKAKNIGAQIFLESLGYVNATKEPSKADWPTYQKIIYEVGATNGVPVIDIYTPLSQNPDAYLIDWVHYTPEGAEVVARTIFNYITQYLNEYGGI